jgi:hypothetical protein
LQVTEALRPVATAIQLIQAGMVVTTGNSTPAFDRRAEGRISPLPRLGDNRQSPARLLEKCKTLHHAMPPYFRTKHTGTAQVARSCRRQGVNPDRQGAGSHVYDVPRINREASLAALIN